MLTNPRDPLRALAKIVVAVILFYMLLPIIVPMMMFSLWLFIVAALFLFLIIA